MPHPQDKERELFEAHINGASWPKRLLNRRDMAGSKYFGDYCDHSIQIAWEAWQAARSLPSPDPAAGKDAAPAQQGGGALDRAAKWGAVYDAASRLIAAIGYHGERSTRDNEVEWLQECLHELDGGEHMPGLMPSLAPQPADKDGARWISTDERLPEHGQAVFIAGHAYNDPARGFYYAVAHYHSDGMFYDAETGDDFYRPTHWAEITQPLAALTTATPEQGGSNG